MTAAHLTVKQTRTDSDAVLVLTTGAVVQRVERCPLLLDGVDPVAVAEELLREDQVDAVGGFLGGNPARQPTA